MLSRPEENKGEEKETIALLDVDGTLIRGESQLNIELLRMLKQAGITHCILFTSMSMNDVVMSAQPGYLSRLELIEILTGKKGYKGEWFEFHVETVVTPTDPAFNRGLGFAFEKIIGPQLQRVKDGKLNDVSISNGSDREYANAVFQYAVYDCLASIINQIIRGNLDEATVSYAQMQFVKLISLIKQLVNKFNYEENIFTAFDVASLTFHEDPEKAITQFFDHLGSCKEIPAELEVLKRIYNIQILLKTFLNSEISRADFDSAFSKFIESDGYRWLECLDIAKFTPRTWDKGSMYAYVRTLYPELCFVYADDKLACIQSAQCVEARLSATNNLTTITVDPSQVESEEVYALALAKVSTKPLAQILRGKFENADLPDGIAMIDTLKRCFSIYFGRWDTTPDYKLFSRMLFRLNTALSKIKAVPQKEQPTSMIVSFSKRLRQSAASKLQGAKAINLADLVPKLEEIERVLILGLKMSGYWKQCILQFIEDNPGFKTKVAGKSRADMSPAEKLKNAFAEFFRHPVDSEQLLKAVERYIKQDSERVPPSIDTSTLAELNALLEDVGLKDWARLPVSNLSKHSL